MSSHPDILEQPERLRGAFWASLTVHGSIAATMFLYASGALGSKPTWGSPDGGRAGSVMVNPVASIPLPGRNAPKNPVANDTESDAPAPRPAAKKQTKTKPIEPDAIPLKSSKAKKRDERASVSSPAPNKYDERNPPRPNQLTSPGGRALSSPLIGIQGSGELGIGTASPFGTQFGEYATRIRDQVARNWKTADIDSRIQSAPEVTVTFTIRRDGSLAPGSKVTGSSGNRAVDFSALRAVLDAVPYPPLPAQYSGSDATVELKFQLRR